MSNPDPILNDFPILPTGNLFNSNTIDELISNVSYFTPDENRVISIEDAVDIMKIYAEWYAKRCLEIAAENATGTPMYDYSNRYSAKLIEDQVNIDVDSILNIKFPEHE